MCRSTSSLRQKARKATSNSSLARLFRNPTPRRICILYGHLFLPNIPVLAYAGIAYYNHTHNDKPAFAGLLEKEVNKVHHMSWTITAMLKDKIRASEVHLRKIIKAKENIHVNIVGTYMQGFRTLKEMKLIRKKESNTTITKEVRKRKKKVDDYRRKIIRWIRGE
ncbi:hypothetical protein P280DRAFT_471182 [Massarina eburnea CBS 473.64]|uniref:Uncharacterized protein n=1 Tax=Massarina eburnea CBS 473.64 TaxID=1395130 RepID=A0A6A6RWL1_9PLEO|nr:hypothetical protein P280DRAFT_471182 [Massarina eburnea CBS 473.64]